MKRALIASCVLLLTVAAWWSFSSPAPAPSLEATEVHAAPVPSAEAVGDAPAFQEAPTPPPRKIEPAPVDFVPLARPESSRIEKPGDAREATAREFCGADTWRDDLLRRFALAEKTLAAKKQVKQLATLDRLSAALADPSVQLKWCEAESRAIAEVLKAAEVVGGEMPTK